MELSIIVPVYNVERYIRTCFESIFNQGLNENIFEVIIVNDGSEDHSMEVIADIISQHDNITVINQENQGLSVARNKGIAASKGEYLLMPDSDDLLIENSLPFLLEQALSSRADLVVADFLKMSDKEIDNLMTFAIEQKGTKIAEKTGEKLYLEDLNPYQCYVWRTLFRRQFIIDNKLSFVPGILYQDVPFTHECYIKANHCIRTNWLLNIYRVNRFGSATASFNKKKAMDFCTAISKMVELTQIDLLTPKVRNKLNHNALSSFNVLLYSTAYNINDYKEKTDIIKQIKLLLPIIPFENGIKSILYKNAIRWMPQTFLYIRRLYGKIIEDRLLPYLHSRK
jgi:glycosyltransferase involved in cell wall biosynthesis